jgi:prolyl oligopeptidase
MKKLIISQFLILGFSLNILAQQDPYMWLEEVDGTKALEFVNKQNKATFDKLSGMKEYQEIYNKSLEIYNSSERIAYPTIYGAYIYNFWQDKEHVRGIWRRTSKQTYSSGNPVWETLIDLDEMSAKDNVKWVFKGASGLYPDYTLFLVNLSKGGGDAVVVREFDVTKKSFVENGFVIEEAKGGANYIDKNTLIVSSDFGPNTMTSSGYPLQAKIWKRGTALKEAQLIHTGKMTDVGSWGYVMRDGNLSYTGIHRAISTFETEKLIWINDKLVKLDIPSDAEVSSLLNNQLIVSLRSDWKTGDNTFKQGSLVSLNFTDLIKGQKNAKLIVEPDVYSSIEGISSTKNKLLIEMLSNVKSELYIYTFNGGNWSRQKVAAPDYGSISITANDELADDYYFTFTNFLTPSTLYAANAGDNTLSIAKSLPAFFDGTKYEVKQYKVKSKDGEMIPYFVVSSKTMKYDSKNPTMLYAYGGFEISETPGYSGIIGNAWLDKGGVYVLANIRGGGEFGPKWHQAGLKEKRQNIYNDFHAVAEDLVTKKITSASNLGIMGGSNGGLLVGVAFTQRPELYNAVVCAVPLLDMQRYNKLLAGASWMGEYGDPDKPEEWEYIKKYSPYHNLKTGVKYPEVFFYTSTRDDRVHPGHARKMAAKMIDMGNTVYYYENTEGGHGGSSTNEQRAKAAALQYTYLLMKLRDAN